MARDSFVIGVDYGTDSVRAIVVNAANGHELASSVFVYPRWRDGLYCDPSKNQFRQHPLDHIEGLETTIKTVAIHRKKIGRTFGYCTKFCYKNTLLIDPIY